MAPTFNFRQFFFLLFVCLIFLSEASGSVSVDELPDLTGGVIPVLSYDTEGTFMSGGELNAGGSLSSRGSIRFIVRVKNQSGDPIEADSLVVIIHKIQEMARLRDMTTKLDIEGTDGVTKDGKPYFYVPVEDDNVLPPFGESESITIEIDNPDLLRLYPPVLRVRGIRQTTSQDFQKTLQTLIQQGVITPEEARNALNSSRKKP